MQKTKNVETRTSQKWFSLK